MASESKLARVTINVQDSMIHLMASYGRLESSNKTWMPAEAFLREWGKFAKDEQVYYAVSVDQGKFDLSLISDAGRWKSSEFPTLEITRLKPEGNQVERFHVNLKNRNAAEFSKRIIESLAVLVAHESEKNQLVAKVKSNAGSSQLVIVFQEKKTAAQYAQ